MRIELGVELTAAEIERRAPDHVVIATGARAARPWWAPAEAARIVDVRDVLTGAVDPSGSVVVIDEIGFHHATSVAELLADRGCAVEVVTPGMVVGQDLGITLDLEQWWMRADAKGIVQSIELVAQGFDLPGDDDAHGGTLQLLHHPTGQMVTRTPDWVVLAVPAEPEDALYLELRAAGVAGAPGGRLRGAPACARRRHRGRAGGGCRGPADRVRLAARHPPFRGGFVTTVAVVVPVRGGEPATGSLEAVSEGLEAAHDPAQVRVLVVGDDASQGAQSLAEAGFGDLATLLCEAPTFAPARLAEALSDLVTDDDLVLLPASNDGRDLAPRLAARLDRSLVAGVHAVSAGAAVVPRAGGASLHEVTFAGPVVATLQPTARGVAVRSGRSGGRTGAGAGLCSLRQFHRRRGARGHPTRGVDHGPGGGVVHRRCGRRAGHGRALRPARGRGRRAGCVASRGQQIGFASRRTTVGTGASS